MSAALLAGLQGALTAAPAWAETICQLEPKDGASTTDKCAAAPDKVAFRAARAQAGEAPGKPPAATHCVPARGLPFQRGAWQLGIDRATGHRCWRLVGAPKQQPRLVPGTKSAAVPKPPPAPAVRSAASASPVAAAAAIEAYGPHRPTEVPTGSITRLPEPPHVNLDRSPIAAEASPIGTPDQLRRDEPQPPDSNSAWTAGQSFIETIATVAATYADAAERSADDVLERASALIAVHGRPAIFLMVFLSVLAIILALYALVVGALKLLRASGLRAGASAIRVTPQYYLPNMARSPKTGFPDEHASVRALPRPGGRRPATEPHVNRRAIMESGRSSGS